MPLASAFLASAATPALLATPAAVAQPADTAQPAASADPTATAQPIAGMPPHLLRDCTDGVCRVRVTPAQLLAAAEKLVRMGKYAEARPLIEALRRAPGYTLQTRFLTGYMAAKEGHFAAAAEQYEAILSDDPGQTSVRLELANAMMAQHQYQSADRQFRIAAQDKELSPEVARTIRLVRDVIRSQRAWRLDVSFGIAPDTNINNATNASTVNIQLGDLALPLTLNPSAQQRSGIGETGTLSAGARLPIAPKLVLQTGIDFVGTNYAGTAYDDYQLQLTAGPELAVSDRTHVSIGAVAAERWYGGRVASRQLGIQAGTDTIFGKRDQLGVQLDVRRSDVKFDPNYNGWQSSLVTTFEHAVSKSVVVSVSVFGRRDWLTAPAYSSVELGGNLGVGGELPLGVNFGISAGASRAVFDAPMLIFSPDPRHDTRFNARLSLGNRKIRVFGFSPEIDVSYLRNESTLTLYDTHRFRAQFSLARYF